MAAMWKMPACFLVFGLTSVKPRLEFVIISWSVVCLGISILTDLTCNPAQHHNNKEIGKR
jgi:hypothetical protein